MNLFDMNGPLMNALRKLAYIFICNIMFCLLSLPMFTAGASLTALFACMQAVIDDCYNEGVKAGDAGVLKEVEEKKKVKLPRKIDDIETGVFKDKEKVLVRGVNIQLDGKNIWN